MRKPKGFWSDREGREDAQLLATEELHALRQLSYPELLAMADRDARTEELRGPSGELYKRRTSIRRSTRGGEELRITVQVTSGSLLGRLYPLAERAVIATPDGQIVGEYTLPSEGNNPRRFG